MSKTALQAAIAVGNRFIGDAHRARGDQILGLLDDFAQDLVEIQRLGDPARYSRRSNWRRPSTRSPALAAKFKDSARISRTASFERLMAEWFSMEK